MHTEIRYDGPNAEAEAMGDLRYWLGDARFKELGGLFKRIGTGIGGPMSCEAFGFYCCLAGVTGYPVRVWYKHLFGVEWREPSDGND